MVLFQKNIQAPCKPLSCWPAGHLELPEMWCLLTASKHRAADVAGCPSREWGWGSRSPLNGVSPCTTPRLPHTHTKGVSPFSSCSGSAPQGQRGAVSSIETHGEAQRAPPPPLLDEGFLFTSFGAAQPLILFPHLKAALPGASSTLPAAPQRAVLSRHALPSQPHILAQSPLYSLSLTNLSMNHPHIPPPYSEEHRLIRIFASLPRGRGCFGWEISMGSKEKASPEGAWHLPSSLNNCRLLSRATCAAGTGHGAAGNGRSGLLFPSPCR